MKKICPVCKIEKDTDNGDFQVRKTAKGTPYFRSECKDCRKQYMTEYYQNNKERIKVWGINYRMENTEEIRTHKKEYYEEKREEIQAKNKSNQEKNKKRYGATKKKWYQNNKKKVNIQKSIYSKNKEKTDPTFRIRRRVSNMIWWGLKENGSSKKGQSCLNFLPCSIQELKSHLEALFEPWMTWENQGVYDPRTWNDNDQSTWTWQLDHIIPQSDLPYTSMTDDNFQKCWALANLRPLSAKQNVIEGPARTRHKKAA